MRNLNVQVTIHDADDPKIGTTYVLLVGVRDESSVDGAAESIRRYLLKSIWEIELFDALRSQGRLRDEEPTNP